MGTPLTDRSVVYLFTSAVPTPATTGSCPARNQPIISRAPVCAHWHKHSILGDTPTSSIWQPKTPGEVQRSNSGALNAIIMSAVFVRLIVFFPSQAQVQRSVDVEYPRAA